jgi:hypothetical protein
MLPFTRRTRLAFVALTLTATTTPACHFPLAGCGQALDEETLNRLEFSMGSSAQMQPGETRPFSLGTVECCYFFQPVETCATWSVEPAAGATMDSHTGDLTIEASVPGGSVFTVSADVENGRRIVIADVHVYTPQSNPLVGTWHEEAQLSCSTATEVTPSAAIGELVFRADDSFAVTWMPFEVYHDYWGTYEYDLAQGTLDMTIDSGNHVPADFDGSGSFSIDDQGRLVLRDLWLGSAREGGGPANCGHRFAPR